MEAPEAWQDDAERHEGSWWSDWHGWISALDTSERVPARVPGDGKLKPIEDAPGSYVAVRLDAAKKKKKGH